MNEITVVIETKVQIMKANKLVLTSDLQNKQGKIRDGNQCN